jgi:arginyl-tRNA synthetase
MAEADLRALREAITTATRQAVRKLYDIALERVSIERPPKVALGDLALPVAFDLARALKKAPRTIAAELSGAITWPAGIRQARVEGGGYLNLFLDRNLFVQAWLGTAGAASRRPGKVVVEHTNINPNKAAHIGHLRNAVLGDVLVRSLRFLGHEVEVQNYIDDTGVQVADVVVGFLDLRRQTAEDVRRLAAARFPRMGDASYRCFGDLCWDVYAEIGRAYGEHPELKELRSQTLHAMELGSGERAEVGGLVASAIVKEHVATMGRVGVAYDLLPRESDILGSKFWARAFELLKERRAVVQETEGKHAGCWVMKLGESEGFSGMDEPDKILVRSNGTVTYTGKDIAYQLWKFGLLGLDFHYEPFVPDWSAGRGTADQVPPEVREHRIYQTSCQGAAPAHPFGRASTVYNVIDVRQSYPQKVVREGLRALGFEAEAERSIHYAYEMVALTPGAVRELARGAGGEDYVLSAEDEKKPFIEMSGRKGLGVKAHDLMDTLLESAREQIRLRRQTEGVETETSRMAIDSEAWNICIGALRYFMLKFGRNKVIAFDFEEALNFEGDSGPYLQYAAVRTDNIFRKLAAAGVGDAISTEEREAALAAPFEDDLWSILLDAASLADVVEKALDTLEIGAIARHAFTLAQAFNQFYHRHPILHAEDAALRARRLIVARVFRREIKRLLELLGIPVPGKM